MDHRNIIVIGASSGSFDVLKQLIRELPANLPAAIFIVWHLAPDARSVLPLVLNQEGGLPAANAIDNEKIVLGRIYVAPPDHHLLVEKECLRVTKGPKENRFRPAVDPLFRSAAYAHGARVVGVVLSGALDDGTAGLWTIKHRGGIAIVQDPQDALYPSMPQNALNQVEVDYCVPASELASLLTRLVNETIVDRLPIDMQEDKRIELEVRIAGEGNSFESKITDHGELTHYACPECHGVLFKFEDGKIVRFRCHTGHAYSSDSLLVSFTEKAEDSMWNAVRAMEESIMLLNQMSESLMKDNPQLAKLYLKKAEEAEERARSTREMIKYHEHLSADKLREQSSDQEH